MAGCVSGLQYFQKKISLITLLSDLIIEYVGYKKRNELNQLMTMSSDGLGLLPEVSSSVLLPHIINAVNH